MAGHHYRINPRLDREDALESLKKADVNNVSWNPYVEDVTDKYLRVLRGGEQQEGITFDDLPERSTVQIYGVYDPITGRQKTPRHTVVVTPGSTSWTWSGYDEEGKRARPGLWMFCVQTIALDALGVTAALGLDRTRSVEISMYFAQRGVPIEIHRKTIDGRPFWDCGRIIVE